MQVYKLALQYRSSPWTVTPKRLPPTKFILIQGWGTFSFLLNSRGTRKSRLQLQHIYSGQSNSHHSEKR